MIIIPGISRSRRAMRHRRATKRREVGDEVDQRPDRRHTLLLPLNTIRHSTLHYCGTSTTTVYTATGTVAVQVAVRSKAPYHPPPSCQPTTSKYCCGGIYHFQTSAWGKFSPSLPAGVAPCQQCVGGGNIREGAEKIKIKSWKVMI